MRLLEFESKQVLRKFQMQTPLGQVVSKPDQFDLKTEFPVMLKAQVPIGGRGKAGGISEALDLASAKEQILKVLSQKIRNYAVQAVLVEEKIRVSDEYFLAVTWDTVAKQPLLIFSTQGGCGCGKACP